MHKPHHSDRAKLPNTDVLMPLQQLCVEQDQMLKIFLINQVLMIIMIFCKELKILRENII